MKIIKILAGLLLVANLAMAETNIDVHINYPSDSVFIGSYNKLEIWIENTDSIRGTSLGFEFSGTLGTIIWDTSYGGVPPVNIENDARNIPLWVNNNYGFGDTVLPDSILVGAVYIPPVGNPLPPGAARECVSLYFYVPEGESIGDFCIDNVFVPIGGDWVVDYGYGPYPPSFHGCPETDPGNPTCPAVCFPVGTTTRQCGDVNGDSSTNFGDAVYIINYIMNYTANPVQYAFADVNCDGRVNIGDTEFLVEYIFIMGPAPCANCP